MEIWTYMMYINDVQLFVTFQSAKTQFWSNVTKISWTQKSCSYKLMKFCALFLLPIMGRGWNPGPASWGKMH